MSERKYHAPSEIAKILRDLADQVEKLPGYIGFDHAFLFQQYGDPQKVELGLEIIQHRETQDGWPDEHGAKIVLRSPVR